MSVKNIFCLLLIVIVFISCKKEDMNDISDAAPVPVKLYRAERQVIESSIDIFGRFYPENQIMVFSKVNGRVHKVYAENGSKVREGQLIAEVIQEIPGQEFAPHRVVSPINGTVLASHAVIGKTVTVQNVLFEVGSLSCLIFKGQVFGADRNKVKTDQIMTLYGNKEEDTLSLSISRISPVVDSITGGLTVEAEICFIAERPVFAGQIISGKINIDSKNEIVIPRIALVKSNRMGEGVFTVNDESKAVFNRVKVIESNENTAVIRGVEDGVMIITEGSSFVSDGVPVKVVTGDGK